MTSHINPYAAPQSAPASAPVYDRIPKDRRYRIAMLLAMLLMGGAPIASAIALYDIESIVVSGPLLLGLALLLGLSAKRRDLWSLGWISVATIAMCIGCFLTIFLLSWSPGDAQHPIGWATVVFAVFIQAGWFVARGVWEQRKDALMTAASWEPVIQPE